MDSPGHHKPGSRETLGRKRDLLLTMQCVVPLQRLVKLVKTCMEPVGVAVDGGTDRITRILKVSQEGFTKVGQRFSKHLNSKSSKLMNVQQILEEIFKVLRSGSPVIKLILSNPLVVDLPTLIVF